MSSVWRYRTSVVIKIFMSVIRGTNRHTDVRIGPLLRRNNSCDLSSPKISLFIESYHIVKVFQGHLIHTSREEFYH